MPISKTAAQEHIKRLRCLPFSGEPADATGARREAGYTLMRWADNSTHAQRIADALMEKLRAFPTPADIAEAARSTKAAELREYNPLAPRCENCGGTGWVIVQRGEYEGAVRCSCTPPIPVEEKPAGPKVDRSAPPKRALEAGP